MDKNILDDIDMRELGKELQRARLKKGWNQADAAEVIGVARTTITAIEKGERRIKVEELVKLSAAYGYQVNDLIRSRPQIEPFHIQFRGPALKGLEDDEKIRGYIAHLEELSRNYMELELLTKSPLQKKYPQEYRITGIKGIDQAAESVATQERNRLGLGDGPIPQLRSVLEQDVGLRIFYISIKPSNYSAMYLYDHSLGGCMAINRLHPEERRRWSLAHDYGHFLTSRFKPVMLVENYYRRVPQSERFADAFAAHFLMPSSGLRVRFNDIRSSKGKVTIADLCTLAVYYFVSVEALVFRLEDLNLLPTGTWDKLQEGGFKVREAQAQLGLVQCEAYDDILPIRYQYLAVDAFDRGLISEGQLARFLQLDRVEARSKAGILRRHRAGATEIVELNLAQSIEQ